VKKRRIKPSTSSPESWQIKAGSKSDGCIVTDTHRKVKKLVLSVQHPEGSMHCDDVKAAERYDAQWNLASDILHLRDGDRSLLRRGAKGKPLGEI